MAQLDADQIVNAAWRVVDRGGLSAFKIRTVADELGVSAMAIYHYVSSKAELAALMVEAANKERPLASPTGDWKEDLWHFANWLRDTRKVHPALGVLHRQYRVWSPALLQIAECWMDMWRQSGLEPEKTLIAARASSQAIVGLVDEESSYENDEPPKEELLAAAPSVKPMFDKDQSQDALFELTVRSIIDGLYMRLSDEQAGSGRLTAVPA